MFTTRSVRLKELLVQKLTDRVWKFIFFRIEFVSSHPRPALETVDFKPERETLGVRADRAGAVPRDRVRRPLCQGPRDLAFPVLDMALTVLAGLDCLRWP